jgi:hypothetical protein
VAAIHARNEGRKIVWERTAFWHLRSYMRADSDSWVLDAVRAKWFCFHWLTSALPDLTIVKLFCLDYTVPQSLHKSMLNEARLAMLRLRLSISFHHQMALVVHACEKLSSSPSLAVEAQGQESQNGGRLFRAEMVHVVPVVRKRNRQIFIVGYCIRVVLRPLACWNCGVESRRGHGFCLVWMLCVVRDLCDGPIPRPEDSCRVCACHWVWSGATVTRSTYSE